MDIQKQKKMFIISIIDAITTQIYFDLFYSGFKVCLSVIILPVIYYFNRKINPLITAVYIAFIGMVSRGVFTYVIEGPGSAIDIIDYPIFAFDLIYGLIIFIFLFNSNDYSIQKWYISVFTADCLSNMFELTIRFGPDFFRGSDAVISLLTIALIRTTVGLILIYGIKSYQLLIKNEEHEKRYKNLLTVISDLKSETYYMKKNMDYIEEVMTNAYQLYEKIDDKKTKGLSLKIANDVHEIKKNYIRVIKGISDISEQDQNSSKMLLKDLIKILNNSFMKKIKREKPNVTLNCICQSNCLVHHHYLLMSVLRNLVSNSFEALDNNKHSKIVVKITEEEEKVRFLISDNGSGIEKNDIDFIFEPGFSTKFNEETGNISRGLGLTLVKNIVEEKFNGFIEVKTTINKGTEFDIIILKEKLMEE